MRLLCLALTFSTMLAGCRADPIRSTVEDLYDVTTPPMGWASALSYTREPSVVTSSWELEPDMTWEQYDQWVRERVAADQFTVFRSATGEIGFRRALEGDVQMLELRLAASVPKVRIAAMFTSRPF